MVLYAKFENISFHPLYRLYTLYQVNLKYRQNHKILLTTDPLPCSPRQDYYPWYEPNLVDLTSVVVKDMLPSHFKAISKRLLKYISF